MNRYWFKPKRYGYGATPATWEGWTLTVGALAVVLLASLMVSGQASPALWAVWFATVLVAVAGLWVISRRRTDGVWRWRWGHED